MPIVLLLLILLCIPQGSAYASSLQEKINQAPPNATIPLEDEVYTGPIVINKPLKLVGKGIDRSVIQGVGTENVVTVTANGVVIKNLTITGDASSLVQKRGNGIQLDHSSGNIIQGLKIMHVQDGIYFDQSFDNVIEENVVTGSRYGFHLMSAGRSRFQKNEVNQSVTGAMVMETNQAVFEQNRFLKQRDTKGFGMLLFQCQECKVIDNVISDNTHGIGIDSIEASKISENNISSNSIGIDIFGPIENSVIIRNSFIGNVQQAVVEDGIRSQVFQEQGVGNYWDDYVGFDVTGDQIGETGYSSQGLLFHWIEKAPALQIMFASPAQSFLDTVAQSDDTVIDAYPLIKPPTIKQQDLRETGAGFMFPVFIFICSVLVAGSISFIYKSATYSRP
ncbi:NosD domain-containing protein [Brevibacillus sp. SYSU BS000544]|uniref:NosD domain-containing protein n=1 Tax=Brevibacillus sp. SYSU BS000544 TaxID=3416443 RepID=UPI003CE4A7CE